MAQGTFPVASTEAKKTQAANMKILAKRKIAEGRKVDLNVFDDEVIGPFRTMGWETFLNLDDPICEYRIREFYSMYSYNPSNKKLLFILNGRVIELTLAQFGAYLGVPSEGEEIFVRGSGLNQSPKFVNVHEAKQLLCKIPSDVKNQVLGKHLKHPHDIRHKIMGWNFHCREGNHNVVPTSIFALMYCLEKGTQVNVASYIAQRMNGVVSDAHRGLPYGMLLNSIFAQFNLPSKPTRKTVHKPLGRETYSRMHKDVPRGRGKRARRESSESIEEVEEEDVMIDVEDYVGSEESDEEARGHTQGASGSGTHHDDDFEDLSVTEKFNYVYREVKAVKKEVKGLKKMMKEIVDFIRCKGPASSQ